jgi:putative tryptophan/tyrosine transport system substrate-binding protein
VNRRALIALLGGAAASWPFASRAQQPRRIGVLMAAYSQADREGQARVAAFLDTFRKLGWTEGRNVQIEYRWDAGNIELIRASVAALVHSAPDLIVASGGTPVAQLHRLTSTMPIVFTQVSDPVESGYVSNLARPGGNITGFQSFETAIGGKWLGMLKEAAPNLSRVAMLFGSDSGNNLAMLRSAEALAPSLGITITAVDIYNGTEFERTVATFASQADGGLVVAQHPTTVANRGSIIILAARYRLPAIYPYRYFTTEGGLMSYGPDQIDEWRRAAAYVDRILRGEKPGDLPVQAPTKYELVINLKTAKALGFNIPPGLPLRADEVIE